MPNNCLLLSNQQARHVWLHLQGMLSAPHRTTTGHSALDTVRQLGMVQLDSISTVVRAHHHILWSRNNAYREHHYNPMLGQKPTVFEHFSHDAVILPIDIYPYWRRQQRRRSASYTRGALGRQLASRQVQKQILAQIEQTGPMCSREFTKTHKAPADRSVHAWMRPPHKLALDYLWLKGDLCVSHRDGFIKYYDISDHIIPSEIRREKVSTIEQIDYLCSMAIERLGFATASQIQRFYDACELSEVRQWLKRSPNKVREISVIKDDNSEVQLYAVANIDDIVKTLPTPSQRMRIISPFDPVVRDRNRLTDLFGMQYRIEIYVPAAKRKYGYYVFPILEADRFTARIDVHANRSSDTLEVKAWWLEPGIKDTPARQTRLRSELKRLAKLANVKRVSDIPTPFASAE